MKSETEDLVPVTFRAPRSLLAETERAVREEDTDKSKFIRQALRQKLRELGYTQHEQQRAAASATA